jgi:hypothetical protein
VGFASSGFKFVSIGQGCVVIVKCMFCFTRDRFRSMGLSNGFKCCFGRFTSWNLDKVRFAYLI